MIRVLHVIDHLDLGGAQSALLDMLCARDRTRFAVEVAVMHGRGQFAAALEADGVAVHSLSEKKWPPGYVGGFSRLIEARTYDVLHFHLAGANWVAKPLAAAVGHPVRIAHDHTSGDLRFRGIRSLVPDAVSHLFSTHVIAVSQGVKNFLCRWEAVSADKLSVVPNGVDVESFRPATGDERRSARERLGLRDGNFVVGGMGRLALEKNFPALVRMAVRLPGVDFFIAGEGPERERIVSLAGELGVSGRVRLLGAIEDRAEFFRALDVFVLPSLHEALPMTILEAMAAGVPVVASRLEGIVGAMREEAEGLFAEADDVEGFVGQLRRLAGDGELRARLAGRARRRVEDDFSSAATACKIEEIYMRELAVARDGWADRNTAR